jgi:peptidoglycan/LPS O-acetylase OafA/YrhL
MPDRQLRSVQILRGLAAFGVVLAHLVAVERKYLPGAALTPPGLESAACGVDLFFVISGFIMTSITTGRPRQPGDGPRFLLRRFTRIYPLYWVYFALILPVFLLHPDMVNSSHGRPDLLTSFFLFPDVHLPLLLVAWTLSFELYFYLVYACVFSFLDGWRTAAALLVWGAAVAAGNVLLHPTAQQPVLHLLCSPLNLEFIAGCFVARLGPPARRSVSIGCIAAAVVVAGAGALQFGAAPVLQPDLAWTRILVYGTAASLLLLGALGLESTARRVPSLFVHIGDSSYSLYLSHILVLAAVGLAWHRVLGSHAGPLNHVAMLAACAMAALVWGWISFVAIEQPLLGLSRRVLHRFEAPGRARVAAAANGSIALRETPVR